MPRCLRRQRNYLFDIEMAFWQTLETHNKIRWTSNYLVLFFLQEHNSQPHTFLSQIHTKHSLNLDEQNAASSLFGIFLIGGFFFFLLSFKVMDMKCFAFRL